MWQFVKGLLADESGQGMVEYGLILALVAVVVIGALTLLGEEIGSIFEHIEGQFEGIGDNGNGD